MLLHVLLEQPEDVVRFARRDVRLADALFQLKNALVDLLEVRRWGRVWVAEDEREKETNNSKLPRVMEKWN